MAKNTIKLKKYVDIVNELIAAAAIRPGELIELTSTALTVQKHSTAGGSAAKVFALEDELQGKSIDDAYAIAAKVQCWQCVPGEEVYAFLKNGEAAVIGSFLESGGNGELTVHAAQSAGVVEAPNSIVAQALEAVDMSDSSGADPTTNRIKIRIV